MLKTKTPPAAHSVHSCASLFDRRQRPPAPQRYKLFLEPLVRITARERAQLAAEFGALTGALHAA